MKNKNKISIALAVCIGAMMFLPAVFGAYSVTLDHYIAGDEIPRGDTETNFHLGAVKIDNTGDTIDGTESGAWIEVRLGNGTIPGDDWSSTAYFYNASNGQTKNFTANDVYLDVSVNGTSGKIDPVQTVGVMNTVVTRDGENRFVINDSTLGDYTMSNGDYMIIHVHAYTMNTTTCEEGGILDRGTYSTEEMALTEGTIEYCPKWYVMSYT